MNFSVEEQRTPTFTFQCPLLAPLRPADGHGVCLFIGVHRKSSAHGQNDASDPSRTFAGQLLGLQTAGEQTLCGRGRALISLGRGLEIAVGRPLAWSSQGTRSRTSIGMK